MQSEIEINKDLDPLKINFKGKRTIGKANKWINVEKVTIVLNNLKIEGKKKEEKIKWKIQRTAKAQCRDRGLRQQ